MPLYEYQCDECEAVEEIRCSYIHEEEVICPYCDNARGWPEMHRIISTGSFKLLGGGFYNPSKTTFD